MPPASPDGANRQKIRLAADAEFLVSLHQATATDGQSLEMALHLVDACVEPGTQPVEAAQDIRCACKAAMEQRLARQIRRGDTCFHLASDSFAVIQAGPLARNGSFVLAARLLMLFSMPLTISGHQLPANVKIGTSVFPRDAENAGDLLATARNALVRAYAGTHGRCVHFDKALGSSGRAMFDDVELIYR